jgi:hypothetical protein
MLKARYNLMTQMRVLFASILLFADGFGTTYIKPGPNTGYFHRELHRLQVSHLNI